MRINAVETDSLICAGGVSFRCQTREHEKGAPVLCRRCNSYMGCNRCTQIPQEIVCLKCNDWALPDVEREHGKMMRREGSRGAISRLVQKTEEIAAKKKIEPVKIYE